jgi:hypothetical protein
MLERNKETNLNKWRDILIHFSSVKRFIKLLKSLNLKVPSRDPPTPPLDADKKVHSWVNILCDSHDKMSEKNHQKNSDKKLSDSVK